MRHILPNNRTPMIASADILDYFNSHPIIGRTITDILPSEYDYRISNFDDLLDEMDMDIAVTDSSIVTDGFVCLQLDDGHSVEINFSGEGPAVLGYDSYEPIESPMPGYYYRLSTMFAGCLGKRIVGIAFGFTDKAMQFPCYCGIDMSADYDGVCAIRLVLDDNSILEFSGWIDYSTCALLKPDGEPYDIKMKDLLADMTDEDYRTT